MPNRNAKELAQEKYNQSYAQFTELLNGLESFNQNNARDDKINHNEFVPFYEAFKTISGDKTEEKAQKSLDTLNGFYNYLISSPAGSQKSNFQILYEEAYSAEKEKEFVDGLNKMNEELGLRINMNHPAFKTDNLELFRNINAIDEPKEKKKKKRREEKKSNQLYYRFR